MLRSPIGDLLFRQVERGTFQARVSERKSKVGFFLTLEMAGTERRRGSREGSPIMFASRSIHSFYSLTKKISCLALRVQIILVVLILIALTATTSGRIGMMQVIRLAHIFLDIPRLQVWTISLGHLHVIL